MESIYMIFTTLATTALAKGSIECSFSKPPGAQCSGAVGQLLIFHLPMTANANTDIRLKKDERNRILRVAQNHTVTLDEGHGSELFTNGTLKLGHAMKRHSGDYTLEEFGLNGALLKKVKMHLEIQAPVSKPVVSQMCISREQKNVSCSAEGEGVEFILTLDGSLANMQPLSGSKAENKFNVSSQLTSTSLHGQLTGDLKCHVWNNVSSDETVFHLTSCEDFSSFPVAAVAVIAGGVTLLLLAALCIINLCNKQRHTTVNEGTSEDEVVYTDVRVIRNTSKTNSHQNAT